MEKPVSREHILAILYEMALLACGATSARGLIEKTLQRLMYHTSFPCGMFLSGLYSGETMNAAKGAGELSYLVEASICAHEMAGLNGKTISIHEALAAGPSALITDKTLWEDTIPAHGRFNIALRLPVPPNSLFLLFAPQKPETSLPITQLFQPILNNFGKALDLARVNEAYEKHIIEDRNHAVSDLKRFKAALDTSADCVFLIDPNSMLFLDFNKSAVAELGYSSSELMLMGPHNIMPLYSKDELHEIFSKVVLSGGGVGEISSMHQRKNGSRFHVEIRLSALKQDGGKTAVIAIARDITERKRDEEMIKNHAKTLEKMNRELEDFAHVASHDMQEPLRTVSIYCQLLQADIGPAIPEKAGEDLRYILEAATRMKDLIDDLLLLSSASRQEHFMTDVKLDDIMNKAMKDVEGLALKTGGKVEWSGLPIVLGDAVSMRRLATNLLSNALKYHGEKPPVVKVSAEREGAMWEITVEDNGIGIDEKYLQQIFAPFKRLHATASYEGTGIGLSICKKIVERHGGVIWAESKPGKGSKFKFTLPAAN